MQAFRSNPHSRSRALRGPWNSLLSCPPESIPPERRFDLDFLVDQLDWEGNLDTHFRDHHYLEPIPVADSQSEGWME